MLYANLVLSVVIASILAAIFIALEVLNTFGGFLVATRYLVGFVGFGFEISCNMSLNNRNISTNIRL
jgi:hypothetical protein